MEWKTFWILLRFCPGLKKNPTKPSLCPFEPKIFLAVWLSFDGKTRDQVYIIQAVKKQA